MIKDALIAIQNRLTTIPELKYISEDWGQLDYYAQPPVVFPCVLIDCDNIAYTDHSRQRQSAVGTITVRVADLRLFDTSTKAQRSDQAYDVFDLLQCIHAALHGLSGSTFAPLTQKSIVKAKRDDAIREFGIVFQTEFYDSQAVVSDKRLDVTGI